MITKLSVYETTGTNPDQNLAVEEYLLFRTEPGECILYLWQNQHTVVIGKNQNCWKECDVSLLSEEKGTLARRLSGGGAVYHDLGNLNFTFLIRKEDYDLKRQFEVIAQAVRTFGIPVEISGRNDLLAKGRKFSGNAFYESGDFCYHHGTILVDVDTQHMSRYLTVSREKLQSKGVDSVRSRVGNLKELCPSMDIEAMKTAMRHAFSKVYGLPAEDGALNLDAPEVQTLEEKYSSWDWKYGRKIPFTHEITGRFSWGGVELELKVREGVIQEAKLYSDGLDTRMAEVGNRLEGCVYERTSMEKRLENCDFISKEMREDLKELIKREV